VFIRSTTPSASLQFNDSRVGEWTPTCLRPNVSSVWLQTRRALDRFTEFSPAIAFHPDMAKATEAVYGRPTELLRKLAREGNAFIGGSFLAWRDGNAYNSFILALPNGKTLRHDKDYPSYWEACYYVGGSDDGVLSTPDGKVGVALCYEFVRSRTAARLKGKVDMVVGGSCWWDVEDTAPADDPCGCGLTF
jgi:predicted amidohydrolase